MNRLVKIFLLVLLATAALYAWAVKFIAPQYLAQVPQLVETMSQNYINGTVTVERFDWNGRLEFTAYGVKVSGTDGARIAEIPEAKFGISPLKAFIAPARALSEVSLTGPQLYLEMNEQDEWNLRDFLKPSDSSETPFYGFLTVRDGAVHVATPHGSWAFGVNADVDGGGNPDFAVDGTVTYGSDELKIAGVVDTNAHGQLALKTDKFALTEFADFAAAYAPIQNFAGEVDGLNLIWENDGENTKLSGKGQIALSAEALLGDEPLPVKLAGGLEVTDRDVLVEGLVLTVAENTAVLDCDIDFADLENIQGKGELTAKELALNGEKLTDVRLPFTVVESRIMLDEAGVDLANGHLRLDGEYNINSGEIFAVLNASGIKDFALPERPQDTIALDGLLAINGQTGVKGETALTVAGNMKHLGWRDLLMTDVDFEAEVSGEDVIIEKFAAFAGDKGAFNMTGKAAFDGSFSGSGRMVDFPLDSFFAAAGQNGSGTATAGFRFNGDLSGVDFYANTQVKNIHLMGLVFPEAHGEIEMTDSVVSLTDYKLTMEQGYNLVNGYVDIGGAEPVLGLTVSTSGIRAEPLVAVAAPEVKLTGNIDNEISIMGPLSAPSVEGSVMLTDGSAEGFLIDRISAAYYYAPDGSVRLTDGYIKALSTEASLSGTMDAAQNLDFTVDITDMDLSTLPIRDETVDLDGFVSAHGSLTGTLVQPRFDGSINSDSVLINGEELKNILGTLTADGRRNNHVEASFEQSPDGMFAAELTLDAVEQNITGDVEFMYGNLRSIMKMAKVDLDIDGTADGRLVIGGKDKGVFADMRVSDIKVKDVSYDSMRFKGRLQKGVLNFDELELKESVPEESKGTEAEAAAGSLTAGGWVNLRDHSLSLKARAYNANPAIVPALLDYDLAVGGKIDMAVDLTGSLDNPQGTARLELLDGSVEGIGFDALTVQMSLADDTLKLDHAQLNKDIYKLTASGDMPLDLLRSKEARRNPAAAMNIRVNLDNARLGLLHLLTPMVEWGVGETLGSVTLSGTLEEPLVYGEVLMHGGSLKLRDAYTIFDNINLDVAFTGNEIALREFSMQMGKGTVTASGNYALRADEDKTYVINTTFKDAEFASEIFTGRINGTAGISPQRYFMRTNTKAGSRLGGVGYRPFIQADIQLDDVLVNMPTIPELSEGSSNYGLDVKVTLGPKIHLYNKYLYDLWLSGGLHVTGSTVYTNIDGNVKADRGTITYLRTPFEIHNASMAWPVPGDILPTVNLDATARFRRYDIFLRVTGPLEQMNMVLRSDPSLTKDQIIKMLTLQREVTGTEQGVTQDDFQNLMTVGLEMTVLGDVEEIFKQTLGLNEFMIYSGRLRTGHSLVQDSGELTEDEKDQYNLLVSKYLTDHLLVGYTVSDDSEHESIFASYDISRHMSINYERNKDYDTTDDWYGVEYKITF